MIHVEFDLTCYSSVSRIWNSSTGQCLKTLTEGHDAIWYASSSDLCGAISSLCLLSQHVQFSPNSKYILSTAHDGAIRLWDYQSTRCLKTYVGHVNQKYCIAACFSVTGGKWIVSGSEDNKVYLWDLQTREVVQTLEGHTDVVVAVSVRLSVTKSLKRDAMPTNFHPQTHPQQNMIASASMDSDLTVRVWVDRTGA